MSPQNLHHVRLVRRTAHTSHAPRSGLLFTQACPVLDHGSTAIEPRRNSFRLCPAICRLEDTAATIHARPCRPSKRAQNLAALRHLPVVLNQHMWKPSAQESLYKSVRRSCLWVIARQHAAHANFKWSAGWGCDEWKCSSFRHVSGLNYLRRSTPWTLRVIGVRTQPAEQHKRRRQQTRSCVTTLNAHVLLKLQRMLVLGPCTTAVKAHTWVEQSDCDAVLAKGFMAVQAPATQPRFGGAVHGKRDGLQGSAGARVDDGALFSTCHATAITSRAASRVQG